MRMIKQTTTMPIPTVHDFDASADNEIGCPYILMDFLKGKPLWQGWFDEEASVSSREQFRARSLQTIAAAMVQLGQFTLDRGGSLRFDSNGRPMDVAGARVVDWLAEKDALQGLTTLGQDCPYCEKGPTTDPASSILFMLDRRGLREKDGPYDRGIHEALRLFTAWTLEKAKKTNKNEPQFVLAHPDFAFQNFLVEDDGTLCGIIDWDGVAAVPLSVGCLRYPDWLTSDWHPWYHYDPETPWQHQNSPQELTTYRNMYAHFVEVFSSIACGSSKKGKLKADTTRMSVVSCSVELAASDLKLTDDAVDIIFEKLEALAVEDDDSDVSDAGSESSVETDTEDVEDEDSNVDTTPVESEDSIPGDEDESEVKWPCSICFAELSPDQPPPYNSGRGTNGKTLRTVDANSDDAETLSPEHDRELIASGYSTEEATKTKEAVTSRKGKATKWALNFVEKGCRGASEIFHKDKIHGPQPTQKARVGKWALGIGGNGCRRASQAFYNRKQALNLQTEDLSEATFAQKESRPNAKILKAAISLPNRVETLLRNITARLHRDSLPEADRSKCKGTNTWRVLIFLQWLVVTLKKLIQKPVQNNVEDAQTPTAVETRLLANAVLVDTEHCHNCNPYEDTPGQNNQEQMYESKINSDDVWARIATEVEKGGIPIDLIKKRCDVMAQYLIQNLRHEMKREEKKLCLKNEKAASEAGQSKVTNQGSNSDQVQHPDVVETGNTASLDSLIIVEGARKLDAIDQIYTRSENDECGPSEPERRTFNKQRFDADMALRGQSLMSAGLGSANAGTSFPQIGDAEPRKSPHDVSTSDATEEANRKLRMVLLGFAKPHVANNNVNPESPQVTEDEVAATVSRGHTKSEALSHGTVSTGAIELANQKLRTILLSLQEPAAANSSLQQNSSDLAEGGNQDSESEKGSQASSSTSVSVASSKNVAAQGQTPVKGGRWFETPMGSLKRVANEEKRYAGLDDQDSISQPDSCFSEQNGGSSKTSVASHGNEVVAKVSDAQLRSPNHNHFEAVKVFQVPDHDDEDDNDVEEFTGDENGVERGVLEDGEIGEEAGASVEEEFNGGAEGTSKLPLGEIVDSGYFAIDEICVALGNGNLDERRMARLKRGFLALLDDAVGRCRR